uniref:Uncharacterized protein n=1 Tax=viral metagenome TaxID=1070528 RepID=A0A6C0M273_9ZZZZ
MDRARKIESMLAANKPVESFTSVLSLSKLLTVKDAPSNVHELMLQYGAQYGRLDVMKLATDNDAEAYEKAIGIAATCGHPSIIDYFAEVCQDYIRADMWDDLRIKAHDGLVTLIDGEPGELKMAGASAEKSDYEEIISMAYLRIAQINERDAIETDDVDY